MTQAQPTRPLPRPGIMDIHAYVPGKSSAPGVAKIYKLSSNESPLGASPKAIAAYRTLADKLADYPDGSSTRLRETIAKKYNLDPARIVCGCGSDDLLHLLASAYIGPDDEGIFTTHGFLVYEIAVLAAGGKPVIVPETNLKADVDAILAHVTERTRMVFLANPNNPTGTYVSMAEIKRLHDNLPAHVMLVIDGAYAEYVRRNDYSSGMELVSAYDNVVMTRTFSKIHGLANLRLGWAYVPDHVADVLNRIRGPFNVNGAALEAGIAAVEDAAHVEAAISHNDCWRNWLEVEIRKLGIEVTPSVGNFVLMHFPEVPGRSAVDVDAFLVKRGLVLRMVKAYGLPNALRMTVGAEEPNRLVVAALADFLSGKA